MMMTNLMAHLMMMTDGDDELDYSFHDLVVGLVVACFARPVPPLACGN